MEDSLVVDNLAEEDSLVVDNLVEEDSLAFCPFCPFCPFYPFYSFYPSFQTSLVWQKVHPSILEPHNLVEVGILVVAGSLVAEGIPVVVDNHLGEPFLVGVGILVVLDIHQVLEEDMPCFNLCGETLFLKRVEVPSPVQIYQLCLQVLLFSS